MKISPSILRELLVKHNRLSMILAVGLAFCSIFLWWLSYAIAWGLTASFFRAWLPRNIAPWILPTVVGFFLLLLVGEMWRSRSGLFDVAEFSRSDFQLGSRSSLPGGGNAFAGGMYLAWLVSQTVLVAPHTTMLAFRRWRSRVKIDDGVVASAVELYHKLAQAKDWVPLPQQRQRQELAYLDRAGLIWSRHVGKLLEVQTFRYEPAPSWWPKSLGG